MRYFNKTTNGDFRLLINEEFDRIFYGKDRKDKFLTIAWNRGIDQKATIDQMAVIFPANTILPLMVNQSFSFEMPESIVAWQFNRDFYCIVNHDKEVGCVGFLFYGVTSPLFITLSDDDIRKIDLLLQVFIDEFETTDNIQSEMLRILLVRLIITITRLGKQQSLGEQSVDEATFSLFRKFNLLVENHYKEQHSVQFYAAALHKSPKTLANVFALYAKPTPLQVIQSRVLQEAKRLLYYTDKSSKEVAAELGFNDASHFSRFFKNMTDTKPTEFKKSLQAVNRE